MPFQLFKNDYIFKIFKMAKKVSIFYIKFYANVTANTLSQGVTPEWLKHEEVITYYSINIIRLTRKNS